jgi:hypothetical protein
MGSKRSKDREIRDQKRGAERLPVLFTAMARESQRRSRVAPANSRSGV